MSRQGEIREKIRISLEKYISTSGYTQKEIAEKLGVSKSSVTNWLKGKNSPDANLVLPICKLLNITIGQFYGEEEPAKTKNNIIDIKTAPLYSSEAMELAAVYDSLDGHGQRVVRLVADEEKARYNQQQADQARSAPQAQREKPEEIEAAELAPEDVYSIPLYSLPMSAGTGEIAGQKYPEDFLLKKRPPRGTSFIARVSGVSMEPTYYNGDLVFVHATVDLRPGQIGAFLMDGQMWIKELGDGVLISHNPTYAPIPMREDIRCQGLVLGVCDESYFE